jgi:hypothetical protein
MPLGETYRQASPAEPDLDIQCAERTIRKDRSVAKQERGRPAAIDFPTSSDSDYTKSLLLGVERMLDLFVKYILNRHRGLISLDRTNCLHQAIDPVLHLEFAKFASGGGTVS